MTFVRLTGLFSRPTVIWSAKIYVQFLHKTLLILYTPYSTVFKYKLKPLLNIIELQSHFILSYRHIQEHFNVRSYRNYLWILIFITRGCTQKAKLVQGVHPKPRDTRPCNIITVVCLMGSTTVVLLSATYEPEGSKGSWNFGPLQPKFCHYIWIW